MTQANANIEIQQEMVEALAGFDRQSRWSTGKGGAVIGEVAIGGVIVQNTMRDSGVRYNGEALPERFPGYKRDGDRSMLPMAQMQYQLSKTDAQGRRVYHLHQWDFSPEIPLEERICTQCPGERRPIEETCNICLETNGVRKKFYSRLQPVRHKRAFHPDELEDEREEARTARAQPPSLMALIATASEEERNAVRLLLGSEATTNDDSVTPAASRRRTKD